jgi:hypothetical protein
LLSTAQPRWRPSAGKPSSSLADSDNRRAYPPGTDFVELIKSLPDEPVPPPGGGPGEHGNEPQPTGMDRTLKLILGVAGRAALAAAAYVWRVLRARGLRQG